MSRWLNEKLRRLSLVGGMNADARHIHSTDGISGLVNADLDENAAIAMSKMGNDVADLIPKIATIVIAGTGPKTATIQLQDGQGNNLTTYGQLTAWLTDSTTPGAASGTTPDGTVTWTTGGVVKEVTQKLAWEIVTNNAGLAVLSVAHTTGAHTWYLCVSVNGLTYISPAITLGE